MRNHGLTRHYEITLGEEKNIMFAKIYGLIWLVVAIVAAGLYVVGAFSMLTAVVFGFICFGLVFMGMMCVLPFTVAHPASVQKTARNNEPPLEKNTSGVIDRLNAFVSAWIFSDGVEMRKPKYR